MILKIISDEAGIDEGKIIRERGVSRQLAMELLYKYGGLKGLEIGDITALHYSTVSQGRKRFRETLKDDKDLQGPLSKIEERLSIIKM